MPRCRKKVKSVRLLVQRRAFLRYRGRLLCVALKLERLIRKHLVHITRQASVPKKRVYLRPSKKMVGTRLTRLLKKCKLEATPKIQSTIHSGKGFSS